MFRKKYIYFIQKLFSPDTVLQHVSLVAGGTVVAQALNVLILPVLSRIYTPTDFGVLSIYSSVVAIMTELSGLRYYLGIPLPKQRRYAYALACLSFILQVIIVIIFTFILCILGDWIFQKLSYEALHRYKYFLPIGVFFIGLYNILNQLCIREKQFATIGKTRITQCLAGAITKVVLGALGWTPSGLLIGAIVSQAGGITTLIKGISISPARLFLYGKHLWRRVLLKYRKFPLYSTWYGLINTIGRNFPQLMLSGIYSLREAGLFSIASSILQIPTMFIGSALGQVFLQRAANALYSGSITNISIRAYLLMLRIGFFPILLISFIAPQIFSVVLGTQWADAGIYAILLVPYIGYNFVYSPMTMLYLILDRQEVALFHEVIYVVLIISALMIGALCNSPYIAVAIYSVVCFFAQMYRAIYILGEAGNSKRRVLISTVYIISEAMLIFAPVGISYYFSIGLTPLICIAGCSFTVYCYKTFKILRSEKVL